MFTEKGPISAVELLVNGIVDLVISPIVFFLRYISRALLMPVDFLAEFFDTSTP